ncbi:hypothetical protein [Candidatus Pyrohabitans sp.]
MLSPTERRYVLRQAYIPEHLVHYFTAISETEPHLVTDYLCYLGEGVLSFIGYPLTGKFENSGFRRALEEAVEMFEPRQVGVISPCPIDVEPLAVLTRESDCYYLLDLERLALRKKLRSLLRSAEKRLEVGRGSFGQEHLAIVEEFLSRDIEESRRWVFERLSSYASCNEPLLLEARSGDALVAFSIFDFSLGEFAFYMFNFISRSNYLPGASDLLLWEFIKEAKAQGKRHVNLGLGINRGIARFKEKWGGRRWLEYEFCSYDRELESVAASYRRMGI